MPVILRMLSLLLLFSLHLSAASTVVYGRLPKWADEFGIRYVTPQQIVDALVQRDVSLRPIQNELKRLFEFAERETAGWKRIPKREKPLVFSSHLGQIELFFLRQLRGVAIHIPKKQFFLGAGCHKTVVKALFLRNRRVFEVAHCISDNSGLREAHVFSKLSHSEGIVPFFGAIKTEKMAQPSLYFLYCDAGDFKSMMYTSDGQALFFEEVSIVKDAIVGLQALHEKEYIHFDLHAGNIFLLKTDKGRVRALLGDLGHAFFVPEQRYRSGYVSAGRVPPEALKTPIHKINRYKTEVYALGITFHEIVWRSQQPWFRLFPSSKVHRLPLKERERYYAKIVDAYMKGREEEIGDVVSKKDQYGIESLTAQERFRFLVYEMLHYDPKIRPSVGEVKAELETILALKPSPVCI